MNKKELNDLKKNFSDKCGFFTFNQVLSAFVDSDKNVICKRHNLLGVMPSEEQELIVETLRKGLSGTLGKNLVEYRFPDSEYLEDGAQNVLYKSLKSKFLDEAENDNFLRNITDNIEYTSTFVVFAAHCTYTMFRRDKNDEQSEENSDYNFILTVFCPVELGEDILIFDEIDNNICLIPKKNRNISRVPSDGFLFPVLTGGDPDINSVICYSSKPKEPNKSIVEKVLGCETSFTAIGEKAVFGKVLSDIVGDDLDYTVITQVNEKIAEEIKEHRFDEKPTAIDDIKLKNILTDVGVSEEKLEKVQKVFNNTTGGKPLTATNLVNTKTVIALPEITVNISKDATDKVRTSLVGGRRCLVIDIDDPNVVINGLPTTIDIPVAGEKTEDIKEKPDNEDDYEL
ncbi:MAG: DUF4317 domain-containing protein [Ruminiclostridium sp.]|nr:DUF4317 domain-containing protein [Ruminiclostridium sp.]